MTTTLSNPNTATLRMDGAASLTIVMYGKATIDFTSANDDVWPSFTVTNAQSKTYGPYGINMSVVITALDGSLTYQVNGGVPGFGYDADSNITSLVDADGNVVNLGEGSSFTQAGTGAVVRTPQSKMRESVSVVDFGAVADGVTDDTAAIQAAVDSLGSFGGTVLMPVGTYKITTTITISKPSVVIQGQGGGGWDNGGSTLLTTAGTIVVFTLTSGAGLRGAQIKNLSINDVGGTALGAVLVQDQWNCLFDNVSINSFVSGYCYSLAASSAIALTSFFKCQGRQNKFGIKSSGVVAATSVSSCTYFSLSSAIAGSIGIEVGDGSIQGSVDSYETGIKLVGDACKVSSRLEGNTTHIKIAGPNSRRNVISGARMVSGTNGVVVDAGAQIFDNVIALNTYSAVSTPITDNSSANTFVYEPQINVVYEKRSTVGTLQHNLTNTRNVAAGDNAEYLASAANTAVKAVLRATTGSPNAVEVGSVTDQIVNLICNAVVSAQLRRDISISVNETALMVRVDRSGTKTLSTVSIGAADSGGSGYRLLRVVN